MEVAKRAFEFLLSREIMQPVNMVMMKMAMHGRGYNLPFDIRQSGEANLVRRLEKRGLKVCLDIGANVGEYTKFLLEHTQATVVAFEPLPFLAERYVELSRKYGERLIFKGCGLGESTATLQIHYNQDEPELSTLADESMEIDYLKTKLDRTASVQIKTLDQVVFEELPQALRGSIDLIKIDVEGFEYQVLSGGKRTLAELRPRHIQIEYNVHQMHARRSLCDFAKLMPGYTCYQLLPHSWHRVDPSLAENNVFSYANFVFARE